MQHLVIVIQLNVQSLWLLLSIVFFFPVVSTSENEMNRQSGAEADHSDTPDGGKPANTVDSC